MLKKIELLGVGITSESKKNILEYAIKLLKKGEKFYIVTPNPEILVYANKHDHYKKVLNDAKIALADGVGVVLASKLLGKGPQERISGVDFIEELSMQCKEEPVSIGFLGGRPGVAERAAECLKKKYPWIRVVFASDEWNEAGFISDSRQDMKTAHQTIDILFVAFGFPKQEEWIVSHIEKLPIKAAMGVGGAFDYLSGEVIRAPFILRKTGFEWLFRLIRQPWRWKRQLALLDFIWLVMKEVFAKGRMKRVIGDR